MDVKETLELLDGVEVIGVLVKKALADGKINVADLPLLVSVVPKLSVLVAATKGVESIPGEMKDLDGAELNQIGAKVLEVIANIKAA